MSKRGAVVVAMFLGLGQPAGAKGKSFAEGLSEKEVVSLGKSLAKVEADLRKSRPLVEALRRGSAIASHPPLIPIAAELGKIDAEIGVFIDKTKQYLKTRDPKVNAFEVKLQAEIRAFSAKLKVLERQSRAMHAGAVLGSVTAILLIADALDQDYLAFDHVYDLAVADIDLTILPAFDVYSEVVIPADVYVIHEEPEAEHHEAEHHETEGEGE
jgi:hypothetical protein